MRRYKIWYSVLRAGRKISHREWFSGVDSCRIPHADFPDFTFYEVG